MYTIGGGESAKDGGGMCMGGEADYSIANIMILTEDKEGVHKARVVYGYEKRVLAMANIGIQSGGAKRGGGAGLGGYYYHPYLNESKV